MEFIVDIQNVESSKHYVSVTGTVNGQQVAGVIRVMDITKELHIDPGNLANQVATKNHTESLKQLMAESLVDAFESKSVGADRPGAVTISR